MGEGRKLMIGGSEAGEAEVEPWGPRKTTAEAKMRHSAPSGSMGPDKLSQVLLTSQGTRKVQ